MSLVVSLSQGQRPCPILRCFWGDPNPDSPETYGWWIPAAGRRDLGRSKERGTEEQPKGNSEKYVSLSYDIALESHKDQQDGSADKDVCHQAR